MRVLLHVLILLLLSFAFSTSTTIGSPAQDSESPTVTTVPATTQDPGNLEFSKRAWPQKLGIRSAFFARQWPAVDTVVLVPDVATWLDEITKWNMKVGRWPVLIEDDYYTHLFVRRFAPSTIIRRPSIGTLLPDDPVQLEALVRRKRITAWAGEDAASSGKTMNDLFRESKWPPPGIVATSFGDPAWPAALTLAIARGQLLRTFDTEFSDIGASVDTSNTTLLRTKVEKMFKESGWSWGKLGDQLQTFTLCRDFSVRARPLLPGSARINLQGVELNSPDPPIALTDFIGRDSELNRFAVCGWIFGDQVRCIYMAMCSVFIDRSSVALFNAYESRSGAEAYRITPAAQELKRAGFEVTSQTIERNASLQGWRRLVLGGLDSDVLFMNTSGQSARMELAGGDIGHTSDIPSLHQPLALQLIHSFSLQSPASPWTIGARWLDRGVYAYVGSCNEPFLAAFKSPLQVVKWIPNYAPFLVASRQYQGPMSKPWRVVTIGDPLMLIERPGVNPVKRVVQGRPLQEGESDLRRDVLRQLRSDQGADAEVYRDLILLNQDDLAISLWERDRELAGSAEAEAILPLLFQRRQFANLVQAYRMIDEPTLNAKNLLWTSSLPRLSELNSVIDLEMLEGALREHLMSNDLDILIPHIRRLKGDQAVRPAVLAALELATTDLDQKRLRNLLAKKSSKNR